MHARTLRGMNSILSQQQLQTALQCSPWHAARWIDALNEAMLRFGINTPARIHSFLAQVGHESGRLKFVRELWNPAQCPWQGKYEGRSDLGNTQPGDGYRYRGRGLIQITGRTNYKTCGDALGLDLIAHPELLEIPPHGATSAAWFWQAHGCNELADKNDFKAITKRINGGLNGQADRVALLEQIQTTLIA
ncbi:MAG: glycoside hydrolase family 19 protein [Pseudomonadota bacterium]